MLTYILNKDLPFAESGDKIILTNKIIDHNCVTVKDKNGMMWEIGFYDDLERLIKEGWIKEIDDQEGQVILPIRFPSTRKFIAGTVDIKISVDDFELLKKRNFKIEITEE